MGTRKRLWPCMAALVCMLAATMVDTPAYAHKVMVFGYLEGGRVHLEGYFADGKKVENSLVEVFAKDGKKLLEGKTDEKGVFSFPMPDVPEVRVVLTGSMGHRAECIVEGGKGAPAREASPDRRKAPARAPAKAAVKSEQEHLGASAAAAPLNKSAALGTVHMEEDRIRAIIAEELDRKLAPLLREVTILGQDRTSLTDVIGGIGYIAGIMGIIMYFKARRRSDT